MTEEQRDLPQEERAASGIPEQQETAGAPARHMAANGEKKKKTSGQIVRRVLFAVCLLIFLGSAAYLVNEFIIIPSQNRASTGQFQEIYHNQSSQPPVSSVPSQWEGKEILPKFLPLLEANPDTVGWLTIPGTNLDHPVFQTPENQNYYLKRDAQGNYNKLGSLFLSADSALKPQSRSIVMYGHNMEDNDEMFGQLTKYQKLDFLKENPVFTFDTLYKESKWKIVSVMRTSVGTGKNDFVYYRTSFADEADFEDYIKQCRVRSLFNIEDDINDEDHLVVFSTCEYVFWGDRLVIVARALREGESEQEATAGRYETNPAALKAEAHYAATKQTPPTQEAIDKNYIAFYGGEKETE